MLIFGVKDLVTPCLLAGWQDYLCQSMLWAQHRG